MMDKMTIADAERAELLGRIEIAARLLAQNKETIGRLRETVENQRLEIVRLIKKAWTDEAIMIGKQIKQAG